MLSIASKLNDEVICALAFFLSHSSSYSSSSTCIVMLLFFLAALFSFFFLWPLFAFFFFFLERCRCLRALISPKSQKATWSPLAGKRNEPLFRSFWVRSYTHSSGVILGRTGLQAIFLLSPFFPSCYSFRFWLRFVLYLIAKTIQRGTIYTERCPCILFSCGLSFNLFFILFSELSAVLLCVCMTLFFFFFFLVLLLLSVWVKIAGDPGQLAFQPHLKC